MATRRESFNRSELKKSNPLLTKFRTTVETAFYGKNMQEVTDMTEAYELALNAAGVIVTDLPVLHTKELGCPDDAKSPCRKRRENHRPYLARARRIIGENKKKTKSLKPSSGMSSIKTDFAITIKRQVT